MKPLMAEELDGGGVVFPRRRRMESEMDITPMIDITFLLLIFFLVASRLDQGAAVQLPAARYGTAVVQDQSVILTIALGPEGRGIVYLSDGVDEAARVPSGTDEAEGAAIAAYVEGGLAGKAPKQYVLIKAERNVPHREVARVSAAVGSVEQAQQAPLHVAVLEVQ